MQYYSLIWPPFSVLPSSHAVHSHLLSHQEACNVGLSHCHWCEVCHLVKVGFLRFLHCSVNFSALVIKKKKVLLWGDILRLFYLYQNYSHKIWCIQMILP